MFAVSLGSELPLVHKPRVLVLEGDHERPGFTCPGWEVVRAHSVAEGLALLQSQNFDGIFTSANETNAWQRLGSILQTDFILEVLREGVAVVQPDLRHYLGQFHLRELV